MKPHHGAMRIGRVARWQRRTTYAVLGACAISGLAWTAGQDAYDLPSSKLVLWWVSHGVTGFMTVLAIGAALPHHVVATWRHRRNRVVGAMSLAALSALVVSALLLLYGAEAWHTASHWTHVIIGVLAVVVFPWHVVNGRRSIARNVSRASQAEHVKPTEPAPAATAAHAPSRP